MKKIFVFTPIFLICVLIYSVFIPTVNKAERISDNVFRLHIIANSDSNDDQALKLLVRDKVLELSKTLYNGCETVSDAVMITENNLTEIKDTAQKVIAFNNYEYEAKAYVTEEYFDTRYYDNFKLPAGEYNSLKIIIGEGKGKNWWCVMFPSVCLTGCTEDFSQSLTDEEIKLLETDKYTVRFKAVEVYEKIKNFAH